MGVVTGFPLIFTERVSLRLGLSVVGFFLDEMVLRLNIQCHSAVPGAVWDVKQVPLQLLKSSLLRSLKS